MSQHKDLNQPKEEFEAALEIIQQESTFYVFLFK